MSNYNTLKTADTINAVSIVDGAITTSKLNTSVTTLIGSGGGPKVTAITYPGNDLAADTAGGQTITLTGTGFVAGCSVFIGTTQASVVTVVSATSVTFTTPALAAATYTLYLVNTDGGTATIVPGISYSGTPTWTTGAGSLASIYEYSAINNTITATGDGSIVYSVFSGTLPTGSSLNTTTGVITGTSPASAGATTYTFVIRATDAQLQDTDRTFSITINTDAVTWTTPAANSTVTLGQSLASTTTLLATSAASNAITYTANTLPTGMSISGATVTGTPTVVGNTTSTFTATAATTNRTATAIINWTVSVSGDTYFPYTTLLLSGATATETFIADASTNNFALAISGDTKPNNFNPYTPGYYSNYFDGSGDYLTVPANAALAFGTDDFTIELWFYIPGGITAPLAIIGNGTGGIDNVYWSLEGVTGGNIAFFAPNSATQYFATTTQPWTSGWAHIAVSRAGANTKLFLNGVQQGSTYTTNNSFVSGGNLYIGTSSYSPGTRMMPAGYISNVRIVKGVAVYTSNFAIPTAPLTAIANTSLLTCQSNRFLDNSTNAFAITKVGDTTVNPTNPFVPDTQYATYGSTYFDGTGDYLTAPSNAAFSFGTGDFTVEFWIYTTFAQGGGTYGKSIMDARPDNTNGAYWSIGLTTTGILNATTMATGGVTLTAPSVMPFSQWVHFAYTRASGALNLWVNGVSVVSASGNSDNISSNVLKIGANAHRSGAPDTYFNGSLSNVRIVKGTALYTTTFTPSTTPLTAIANTSLLTLQTNQPANNSVFLDSSTNALAVTRVGNTSAGTFSPYGANWSNYFDGTGDNLLLPFSSAFNLPADFTIECWIFPISASGMIINCGGGSNIAWASYELVWYGSAVNFAGSSANNGYDIGSETGSTGTIGTPTLNQWSHIAVTRSGNIYRGFLNGVQGYTQTLALTPYNQTTRGLAVGSNYDNTWGLTPASTITGNISNLRIVKGTAVYTANFTPSTTPLTAIANTSILTCQSNRFVDNSTNAFAITKNGDTRVQRFSPFNPSSVTPTSYSGYFGVAGEYLNFTNTNNQITFGTANFTIEFWVNFNNPTSTNTYNVVFRNYNTDPFVTDYFYLGKHPSATVPGAMSFWVANYAGSLMLSDPSLPSVGWNHFAIVRNSNIWTMYRNGTSVHSVTSSISMGTRNNNLCQIGVELAGYESNLRVVTGTAVYTSNFTPSTSPLTAISGTSLLTCQSTTFIDNSTNNFTITAISNSQPTQQNPFGFTIDLTNGYTPSTIGGSGYFDGTGDYLLVGSTPGPITPLISTGAYMTIEAWVYATTLRAGNANDTHPSIVGLGAVYMNFGVANGTPRFMWYNGAITYLDSSIAITANTWNHIAVVFNGSGSSNLKIYVNGVLGGTGTFTNLTWSTASGGNNLYIGAVGNNQATSCWPGYINNVRITNSALYTSNFTPPSTPLTAITNTSLLLSMTSAGIVDATMINDLETVGDAKILSTQTPYAGSYYSNYFDGTGDYLTAGTTASNFLCTGSASGITATFEAWVYLTAYNTGGSPWMFSPVHSKGVTYFNFGVASGKVRFYWNGGGLGNIVESASTSDVPLNTWTHIALTISGTTFKIYVNGTLNTTSVTNSGVNAAGSGGAENIGYEGNQPTYFTGYISNYRLTNTIVYSSTFTPSITPLTAISGTQLLTCQSNRFVDNSTNAFAVTRTGDTSVQSFNPFQRNSATTMYFDGTGDYLSIPINPLLTFGTRDFTVETWIYLPTVTRVGIIGMGSSGFFVEISSGTNIHVSQANVVDLADFAISPALSSSTWYHFAITRSGTSMKAFINGVQQGSTVTNSTNFTGTNAVIVGGHPGGIILCSGYINDLRITKGTARYTSTFTPPTTAFIAR